MPEALVVREIVENKKDEYLQEADQMEKRVGEDATKRFVFTDNDREKEPNSKLAKQIEAAVHTREYGGSIRMIVESYPQGQNLLHQDRLEETEERLDRVRVNIEGVQAQIEELKKTLTMSSTIVITHMDNTIYIYNSEAKNWQECNVRFPFGKMLGGAILKEELYVIGSIDRNDNSSIKIYKLDGENEWHALAEMNEERKDTEKSTIVFNEEIWVIGGRNRTKGVLKSVEKYNPETDSWTLMAELNHARDDCAAVVIDNKIYVCGGCNGEKKYLKSMEVYDPDKKKWEIFCDLPFGLCNHSALVDGTNLIIIGGDKSDGQISKEVLKMDISNHTNNWEHLPDLSHKHGLFYGAFKTEERLMVFNEGSTEMFDGKEWRKRPVFLPMFPYVNIQLSKKDEELFLRKLCS